MDKALKQRLVGASVLIIFAVIVLPMLLSGRSDTLKHESRLIELPSKPAELSFETRRFPVGQAGTANTAVEPRQAQSANETSQTLPKTVVGSPKVATIVVNSATDKQSNIMQSASESVNTPRYLVQVASFSSLKRANALAASLRSSNMAVLMDVVERTGGRLHRVRVGPYVERPEADTVVATLREKMPSLNPRVLDLRPTEMAPVSMPSDPLVRWVVQVGSFNDAKRAEDLVASLQSAGMSAFFEKVSAANGVVYKVLIGPEIDRGKAVEMARKVKREHNLDGFVTTRD